MLERGERAAERVLGPALRVGLDRIVEEAIEGGRAVPESACAMLEFAHQVGRFRHDEVIAMRQRLAQRFDRELLPAVGEARRGRRVVLRKLRLPGMGGSLTEECAWTLMRSRSSAWHPYSHGSCRVVGRGMNPLGFFNLGGSAWEARVETGQSWQFEAAYESGAGTRAGGEGKDRHLHNPIEDRLIPLGAARSGQGASRSTTWCGRCPRRRSPDASWARPPTCLRPWRSTKTLSS